MNKETEKRMYVLVPYNLSDIQKGIQAAHAIAEHVATYFKHDKKNLICDWLNNWKTIIILNGGTTGDNGSLQMYESNLLKLGVKFTSFQEPDLNNATTAVAFVVDMDKDSHIVGYLKQMGLA